MFPKDNIARDTKMMRDRIITPIPLLSFAIAKKTTKPWPRLKFVMLMWLKKNETSRTEAAKVVIVWRWPKKALIWSLILDNRTWNPAIARIIINKDKKKYRDPPILETEEGHQTSEWTRSKISVGIDSLVLKGKAGCFPNWHEIQLKFYVDTEPNKPLEAKCCT